MMKLGVQVAKGCHLSREDRMMICGIVLRQHRNVTDDRRHPRGQPSIIDRRLAKNQTVIDCLQSDFKTQ